jgi:hypothetical protein
MKHKTVRFYTDSGEYMWWKYKKNITYEELRAWLLSGNSLIIDKRVYNSFNSSRLLLSEF